MSVEVYVTKSVFWNPLFSAVYGLCSGSSLFERYLKLRAWFRPFLGILNFATLRLISVYGFRAPHYFFRADCWPGFESPMIRKNGNYELPLW